LLISISGRKDRMNNSLPYFSHDNNALEHPKMQALITAYGFEGYGRFWALNEAIAACEDARLDISRRVNRLALAHRLGFTEEKLSEFIDFLADPELDLVSFEGGIVTTDRTQEDLAIVHKGREKNRKDYENRKKKNYTAENAFSAAENQNYTGENGNSTVENIQSRVEKSRKDKSSGGRSEYSDPGVENFTPVKNAAGPPTLPPPQLLQKIKDASSRAGYAIQDNLAKKLADLDPGWFDGACTFPEYVAGYIRGHAKYRDKPPEEQRDLYRKALWSWENLRENYPAWRAKQAKIAAAVSACVAKKNPPSTCPACGIAVKPGRKCTQCGGFWSWDEAKNIHVWQELLLNPLPGIRRGDKITPQEIPKTTIDFDF